LADKTRLTLISNFHSLEVFKEILKEGIVSECLKQNIDKLDAYTPNPGDFFIERVFNSNSSKVWEAISNQDIMKKWYFDLKDFKPEVGFKFSFVEAKPPK